MLVYWLILARAHIRWGVDFLKNDDCYLVGPSKKDQGGASGHCGPHQENAFYRYEKMHVALANASAGGIVHSVKGTVAADKGRT